MQSIPILIVEDRQKNKSTYQLLRAINHLEDVWAESVNEALAALGEHEFAAVFISEELVQAEGYNVYELVQSRFLSSSAPVILTTERKIDSDRRITGYESGIVDYLEKPLQPAVLQNKATLLTELHGMRLQLKEKSQALDKKNLELEVLQKELEEKNERFEQFSSLDELTGLFNRNYFDDNLLRDWRQALRDRSSLSLLIVGVDSFVDYCNLYGAQQGDVCLHRLAVALYDSLLRPVDIIARYSEMEFAVILPNTSDEGAKMVAERMLTGVAHLDIPYPFSPFADFVTVSIGGTSIEPTTGVSLSALVESAQVALKELQQEGGNSYLLRDIL